MADVRPAYWGSPHVLVLTFTTRNLTPEIYDNFINNSIPTLSTGEPHLGFPSLPYQIPMPPYIVHSTNCYFFIRLSNGEQEITYVGRRSDLYLIGYASPFGVYHFADIPSFIMRVLFPDPTLPIHHLQFYSTYSTLQDKGLSGKHRTLYPLSFEKLDHSVENLFYLSSSPNFNKRKDAIISKGFLLSIQIFCEAFRLRNFRDGVGGVAGDKSENYVVTALDAGTSERWTRMSTAVLASNDLGAQFPKPIELMAGLPQFNVGTVEEAGEYLQTLKRRIW